MGAVEQGKLNSTSESNMVSTYIAAVDEVTLSMDTHNLLDEWLGLGSRQVATNGIELRVVEHGDGPAVLFCSVMAFPSSDSLGATKFSRSPRPVSGR